MDVGAAAVSTVKCCARMPSLVAATSFSNPPNRRRQLPISSSRVSGVRLIRGVKLPAQQARLYIASTSLEGLRARSVMVDASIRAAATPIPFSMPACRASGSHTRMRPCSTTALGEDNGALASSGRHGRWSASHKGFMLFAPFDWPRYMEIKRPATRRSTSLDQIDAERSAETGGKQ